MTVQLGERTLVVESRDFGVLDDPDRGFDMWPNTNGVTYIGATWWKRGQGKLYANVPADTVTVLEVWSCTWYMGLNTECGDDATAFRDGLALCDRHAHAFDILTDPVWDEEPEPEGEVRITHYPSRIYLDPESGEFSTDGVTP